jgi:hypothetical protein
VASTHARLYCALDVSTHLIDPERGGRDVAGLSHSLLLGQTRIAQLGETAVATSGKVKPSASPAARAAARTRLRAVRRRKGFAGAPSAFGFISITGYIKAVSTGR